jgi:hypothetical protein
MWEATGHGKLPAVLSCLNIGFRVVVVFIACIFCTYHALLSISRIAVAACSEADGRPTNGCSTSTDVADTVNMTHSGPLLKSTPTPKSHPRHWHARNLNLKFIGFSHAHTRESVIHWGHLLLHRRG